MGSAFVKTPMYGLVLMLCLGSLFVSCKHQQIDEEGPKLSAAEQALKEKAMYALGRGDHAAEEVQWKTLLRAHPNSPLVAHAHIRIGLLRSKAKDWAGAHASFVKAKASHPSREQLIHMSYAHAQALAKLKRPKEAREQLAPHLTKLPWRSRKDAVQLLLKIAKKSKDKLGQTMWLASYIPFVDKDQQYTYQKKVIALLPSLNISQTQTFLKRFQNLRTFPANIATYQLARLYYDRDQFKKCYHTLARLAPKLRPNDKLKPFVEKMLGEVRGAKRPAEVMTLGVIYLMTGQFKAIGKSMRQGIELALVNYPQIRVIYRDTGSQPHRAAQAVDVLVKEYKAIALIGPPMPKTATAAAKRAQKIGVPLISITTKEKFTQLGSFIFRNNLTLSMMGRGVARYAFQALKLQRIGILYPHSKYGLTHANAFINEAKKIGAVVGSVMHYDPASADFQFPVRVLVGGQYANAHLLYAHQGKKMGRHQRIKLKKKALKMLKPLVPFEGLFVPDQAPVISQIASHLAYYNVGLKKINFDLNTMMYSSQERFRKIQLLGNNGWYHQDLFRAGERYVRGGIFCVRFFRESFRASVRGFVDAFTRTYKNPPLHISAYAYDTMRMLASIAITRRSRTRPQFRKALLRIRHFGGPTGPITMQKNREAIAPLRFVIAYKKKFRLHGVLR